MAFVSTPSSTNEVNTVNVQVSTVNSIVSTDSTLDSTANLSDATAYAFLSNQPNGSQLVHEDLEQIDEDDLEEIDLKWQLALLSMRARRYYQRTGKKITINGSDTEGYGQSKNQTAQKRTVNVERNNRLRRMERLLIELVLIGSYMAECGSPYQHGSYGFLRLGGQISDNREKRPINTVVPKSFVNAAKTRPNTFQKSHSLSRRTFYQQTSLKNRNLNDKVNTAKINSVNTAKGKRVTSVVEKQGINAVNSSA
ncbi:hypothetical protein Tco_0145892 [Tanacetum coccineum]